MSSDNASSAVTYTSISSEARSWSIPIEDPYEEAARQALEQAPPSPAYVLDPMELEHHVPPYHRATLLTDPEEDEEDPEENPTDYPANKGDDDDESSDDDDDDDDAEEEEEDHLAPADSTVVASSAIDLVPSTKETEPFPPEAEVARLLALPTPPPSPLTPLSSPLP
ncbi:hypothetical protein Tco_0706199 [Tanacetum coccineum]|uniref:Uncharacterized protein n=1 Tax=Tanacetum coccineum TaxID=301880 RepID=A0ABQ4Y8A9_9ASTR